jgi:hypothetical protein
MSINQAKSLIEAGFDYEEIKQGIEWCVEHPPKKGFQSLGWLSYDLENILVKVKAKQTKKEMDIINLDWKPTEEFISKKEYEQLKKQSNDRVNKDFDFGMFEE